MNFQDLILISLRAIASNGLRSLLTTLGIIIGVSSVIILMSLGQGAVKGVIDEVALFNIAFDEKTINTIMTEGLEGALAISSERKLASVWANIKTR